LQAQPAPCDQLVSRTFSAALILSTVLDLRTESQMPLRYTHMASATLRSLRAWIPVVAVSVAVLLLVGVAGVHPALSRQQAIDAALSELQASRRYAVKLVRESDFERAAPDFGRTSGPDYLVWVVAVSGDYGMRGESGGPPTTWGVALVNDQRPAQLSGTLTGVDGDWPSFFDRLIDLN
jgi:hypothetical protein